MKWRGFSLLVALAALILAVQADEWTDAQGVKWTYSVVGSVAVLDRIGRDAAGDVTVPESLGGCPVAVIGSTALSSPTIVNVTLPASITNVGERAFIKCNALESIFFMGDMPTFDAAWKTENHPPSNCVIKVSAESRNWRENGVPVEIPGTWQGYQIERDALNPLLTCTFNPPSGTAFEGELSVTLTNAVLPKISEYVIRYTLDGSEPTEESPVYAEPIVLHEAASIKCCAYYTGGDILYHGPVATAVYSAPLPDGGPYVEEAEGRMWTFTVRKSEATITRVSHEAPAVPETTEGAITLPAFLGRRPVVGVDVAAFERCRYLTEVTLPASMRTVASFAFRDCLRLTNFVYQGKAPAFDLAALKDAPVGTPIVKPSSHTNYVNVAVEVQGDVVGVPDSWLEELAIRYGEGNAAAYSNAFIEVFGDDLGAALLKPSGKIDLTGNALTVWQDYVAGTNPLDGDDYFRAGIEMTDEGPVVSWSPVLTEDEAARRVYMVWGAATLGAATTVWKDVSALTPAQLVEKGYRFFKVTVKMVEAPPPEEAPPPPSGEEETPSSEEETPSESAS